MPLHVDLTPPPQFDKSLLSYVTTNFNRIRDALLFGLGGDLQTGDDVVPAGFIGGPNFGYNIIFPRTFTTIPLVIANCYDSSGPQWHSFIGTHNEGFFAFWGTSLGGNVSAATRCKWLAIVL